MLLSTTGTIQTRKDRYFSDKDMRKTVSILLAVLFVFTVTACKKKEQKVSSSSVISDVPVTYVDMTIDGIAYKVPSDLEVIDQTSSEIVFRKLDSLYKIEHVLFEEDYDSLDMLKRAVLYSLGKNPDVSEISDYNTDNGIPYIDFKTKDGTVDFKVRQFLIETPKTSEIVLVSYFYPEGAESIKLMDVQQITNDVIMSLVNSIYDTQEK